MSDGTLMAEIDQLYQHIKETYARLEPLLVEALVRAVDDALADVWAGTAEPSKRVTHVRFAAYDNDDGTYWDTVPESYILADDTEVTELAAGDMVFAIQVDDRALGSIPDALGPVESGQHLLVDLSARTAFVE